MLLFFICKKNQEVETVKNDYDEELIKAMDEHNYDYVLECLDKGANPDIQYNNVPLLYYCSKNNLTDIAISCVDSGANLNWSRGNKNSLYYSILNNNEISKKLISSGIKLPYYAFDDESYFSLCVKNKNYEILYLLLENDSYSFYLKEGFISTISVLFNTDYFTDESISIYENLFGKYYSEELLSCGLMKAIQYGNVDGVKYFISKKLNLTKKYNSFSDGCEYTPLEYANKQLKNTKKIINDNKKENKEIDSSVLRKVENLQEITKLLK